MEHGFHWEEKRKRGYFSAKSDLKGCRMMFSVLWLTEFVLQFGAASALVSSPLLQQ